MAGGELCPFERGGLSWSSTGNLKYEGHPKWEEWLSMDNADQGLIIFFSSFSAIPVAYGSSRAVDQNQASASTYATAKAMPDP